MTTETELLPCKCGAAPDFATDEKSTSIFCPNEAGCNDGFLVNIVGENHKALAIAAWNRRPLTPSGAGAGEGVKVKPLIWDAGAANPLGVVVWSSGDPWLFWIVKRPETNFIWCESLGFADSVPASPVRGSFDTLAEAQAAAQADFDRRIRSALTQEGGE